MQLYPDGCTSLQMCYGYMKYWRVEAHEKNLRTLVKTEETGQPGTQPGLHQKVWPSNVDAAFPGYSPLL